MKKIAYSLMAMAIAAFTFTSCEDVPAPFGQPTDPGSGEGGDVVVIEPSGSGTEADPYNVAAAIEIAKAMSGDDAAKEATEASTACTDAPGVSSRVATVHRP